MFVRVYGCVRGLVFFVFLLDILSLLFYIFLLSYDHKLVRVSKRKNER